MKYSTIRTEFSEKYLIEIKEMDFKNGVIDIQAMGYNGARTVYELGSKGQINHKRHRFSQKTNK